MPVVLQTPTESVICMMMLYSYGFGLFGQIGKAASV